RPGQRRPGARGQPSRPPVDPGARGGWEAAGRPPLRRGGNHPARRAVRRGRTPRAARLPVARRRPDRVRGAPRGLHGRRLPRAADAAGAVAVTPRNGDAARRERRRARRARAEVDQIRELIDEVMFLSELESGTRVVSLGSVAVRPELDAVAAELEERASRAGVAIAVEGEPGIELAIRPRMIRVVAQNLAENAIRYAGPGATFTLAIERVGDAVVLRGTDDGVGVEEAQLGRLFERFFRADRARASRGTGLGLAIVKHVVTQAGGTVEALGGLGAGLEIRCTFPTA